LTCKHIPRPRRATMVFGLDGTSSIFSRKRLIVVSTGLESPMLVFSCALRRVHSPGSGLGEIKDEETGENLLEDKVRLLCVKMDEAYGVFQAAEGGLNPQRLA
jgi:hypothetical protein